ncbi:hypothetical protein [Benzoatithermus flavus]|uniref:FlgN protein n=1 Tax=Benzoatithermus flavus TaxID=3108223 RepID=A0ABU8XVT8_9PROT
MIESHTRIVMLLALMRELEGIMQAENALLGQMKLERLQALQAEKAALAERYELELRRLRQKPEALAELAAEERATLDAALRGFQATVRANAERLRRARQIAEGVVQAIGESLATSAADTSPGYGTPARGPAGGSRIIAVAFDRRC